MSGYSQEETKGDFETVWVCGGGGGDGGGSQ